MRGQSSAKSNLLVLYSQERNTNKIGCMWRGLNWLLFKRLCQDVAGQCFYDNFCMLLIQNKMTSQQIKVGPVA